MATKKKSGPWSSGKFNHGEVGKAKPLPKRLPIPVAAAKRRVGK